MKVAILGTGFGAYHAELWKNTAGVYAVTIWGRNREKAGGIAAGLGIRCVADIDEVLENPEIGLVDVCLPNALHREYIELALRHGKDVFCETPLCVSADDAAALLEAERRSGKRVFVNQFIKFFAECAFLKAAMDDRRYGRLLSLHAWRKTPPIWGALGPEHIVTNLMIHELDLVTWVLGEPEDIAVSALKKDEDQCIVNASLDYGNATALVTASSMMPAGYPFRAGFHAIFENTALEFDAEFPDGPPVKKTMLYTEKAEQVLDLPAANPYEAAVAHVADCCTSGVPTVLSLRDAAAAARLAVRIREKAVKAALS